jgi:hypothetical protein
MFAAQSLAKQLAESGRTSLQSVDCKCEVVFLMDNGQLGNWRIEVISRLARCPASFPELWQD